ncbi:hypothetical protein quinque_009302 [Culex quinquefasciatus]
MLIRRHIPHIPQVARLPRTGPAHPDLRYVPLATFFVTIRFIPSADAFFTCFFISLIFLRHLRYPSWNSNSDRVAFFSSPPRGRVRDGLLKLEFEPESDKSEPLFWSYPSWKKSDGAKWAVCARERFAGNK